MKRRTTVYVLLALSLTSVAHAGRASPMVEVPLSTSAWETKGAVVFRLDPASHWSIVEVEQGGSARLKDFNFGDGLIELDVKPKSGGIEGVKFRQDGRRTADALYFRAQPHCDVSDDCIQYMPYAHGAYEWDLFPEYQTHAPLQGDVWNHVKLVISGRRMRVYVNQASRPTLEVGRLEGDLLTGAFSISGPASYAHLQFTPGRTEGLSGRPMEDPTASDLGYIRAWEIAGPYTLGSVIDSRLNIQTGVEPTLPPTGTAWRRVSAERKALVNLSRIYGSAPLGSTISQVWLRTSLYSDKPQIKQLSLGWLREAWVFVNGKKVFAARNLYGTAESRPPGGALSLQNATIDVPLHRGINVILIALDDNFSGGQHFGWGLQARWKDTSGISPRRPSRTCASANGHRLSVAATAASNWRSRPAA